MRDALGYHQLAEALLAGRGFVNDFGYPEVVRTPGYPLLLAGIYWLVGPKLWAVYFAHAVLHAISTFLLMKVALLVVGPRRSWILALGFSFALFPFTLFTATRVLTETLTTTLLLGELTVLVSMQRWARFPIAGVLLGLTAVVRPSFALLPFALALLLYFLRPPLRDLKGAAAMLGAALLFTAPWSVRTSLLTERPSLMVAGLFGVNLHIASWEYRDLSAGLPRTTDYENPTYLEADRRAVLSILEPRGSVAWTVGLEKARVQLGVAEIRAHPWLYLRSSMMRVLKLWTSQHHPKVPNWIGDLAALVCLTLLGLGVFGAWRTWPWSDAQKILLATVFYLCLLHLPLHAEARYSIPVRPILLLFVFLAFLPAKSELSSEAS